MHGLRSTVISDGVAIVVQAQTGNMSRKPVDKARQHLLNLAEDVETAYLSGDITAEEVLLQGASHFDNDKLYRYLSTVQPLPDVFQEQEQEQDPENELPDVDVVDPMDVDEREAILNADEGLQDMDEDPWITTVWPSAAAGKTFGRFLIL